VTVGLIPLTLFGMAYTTLILLRRRDPDLTLAKLPGGIWEALASPAGLLAFIVSIGAVFTAWSVQCYRNPVWGPGTRATASDGRDRPHLPVVRADFPPLALTSHPSR